MGAGRNAHIGWAEESTWGTSTTPTKFAELVSESLGVGRDREAVPVTRDLYEREGRIYDAKFYGAGSFAIEASYEGLLRLLEHTWGASVDALVSGTQYSHTMDVQAGEIKAGKGLSLSVFKDITLAHRYVGAKINRLKISAAPERNVQFEFDVVAKDVVEIAETSPTFPGSTLYCAGHQTTVEIDDAVQAGVTACDLTIDNGLDDGRRGLGSKNIIEPVRGGTRPSITGTMVLDATQALWQKAEAGTLFKLELICTGPALAPSNYSFAITALKCIMTEDPVKIEGPGIVKASLAFKVLKPASGLMLNLVVKNTETAVA
jgi:hypothetical protein